MKPKMDGKIIYPKLSYQICGICFSTHNQLGRYCREKQYGDVLEKGLRKASLAYQRELAVGNSGNTVDFLIEDKIVLELKAKRLITKEDYYQLQRYLQELNIKLGLLVNFRSQYLKPSRVIKIN
jgi:GxxExxY protein